MTIIINGRQRYWNQSVHSKMTYSYLIKLAGYSPGTIVSVSWSHRDGSVTQGGVLSPGYSVTVKDGMIFYAHVTGNA